MMGEKSIPIGAVVRLILDIIKWSKTVTDIVPRETHTFLTLALEADDQGKVCMKFKDLMDKTGLCKVTLRRALHDLNKKNLIWLDEQNHGPKADLKLIIPKLIASIGE